MIKTFSSFREWRAAVEARGLVVEVDEDWGEGPQASDAYATHLATDSSGIIFGSGANDPRTEAWAGVLFDTEEEYNAWLHEDDNAEVWEDDDADALPYRPPVRGFGMDDMGRVMLWPSSMTREAAQVVVDGVLEARRGVLSEKVRLALLTLAGEEG